MSKSNTVRPRMSRESFEWLQSIEGETNDERIDNLRNELFYSSHKALRLRVDIHNAEIKLDENEKIIRNLNKCLDIKGKEKIRIKSERDNFIVYLGVSMVINFSLLGYIATLQGWF